MAGEGHLVIRAVRADTRAPLDAVRRPIAVRADARFWCGSPGRCWWARVSRCTWTCRPTPASAARASCGLPPGVDMFGAFSTPDAIDRGWTRRMAGIAVPDEELGYARTCCRRRSLRSTA
ncbi:MAG: hypothetical protein IPH72_27210 [Sandaracinaceae bacterium]|nr:hypothetical protein [Sandaracinaceae bacterium]